MVLVSGNFIPVLFLRGNRGSWKVSDITILCKWKFYFTYELLSQRQSGQDTEIKQPKGENVNTIL